MSTKKSENLDCPLCHEKSVVQYIPASSGFQANPGPKGLIGNYSITHEGGFHDASQHVKKCKALKDVENERHKAHLLGLKSKEFIFKHKTTHRDFLTFEHYQNALKAHGLLLTVSLKREKATRLARSVHENDPKKWVTIMSIDSSKYPRKDYEKDEGSHYPEATGDDPERAFDVLRDRLICGEAIKIRTHVDVLRVWRWDGHRLVHQQRKPTKANLLAI